MNTGSRKHDLHTLLRVCRKICCERKEGVCCTKRQLKNMLSLWIEVQRRLARQLFIVRSARMTDNRIISELLSIFERYVDAEKTYQVREKALLEKNVCRSKRVCRFCLFCFCVFTGCKYWWCCNTKLFQRKKSKTVRNFLYW